MSKLFSAFTALVGLIMLIWPRPAGAQPVEAALTVTTTPSASVLISGRFEGQGPRNFALRREWGGIAGLADRLSEVELLDAEGRRIQYRQFAAGELEAERNIQAWRYRISLTPSRRAAASAHVSWMAGEVGLIFLDDVLPAEPSNDKQAARVRIELPPGWKTANAKAVQLFADRRTGVFLIGRSIGHRTIGTAVGNVAVAQTGDWKFTADELDAFVVEILREYQNLFGRSPRGNVSVNLLNFPVPVAQGAWEADTRGSTVSIVSSDMPFRTQSLQRLHEQLRHELFHLWLPNSINLTGNYDWFYEGAALYWSLRTAVALNRIRFEDLLNTLAHAHTIDSIRADRRSLLDASGARTIGDDTSIYARGMLTAFLIDIHVTESSGGKRDLASLLRKIFSDHSGPSVPKDGNTVIIGLIGDPAISKIITTGEPIDWTQSLMRAGIAASAENNVTTLRVVSEPSRSQRRTLDKLGYNNWMKLSQRSK